jgi:2-methylaconitate cis-trans-isomerase PrpF
MGTGSCCLAPSALVPGTVSHDVLTGWHAGSPFIFGHPGGTLPVYADILLYDDCNRTSFKSLGFGWTARKIADCLVYVTPSQIENIKANLILPKAW